MHVAELSKHCFLFTFDGSNSPFAQQTVVCCLVGRQRLYLIDTHTGPKSMIPVKAFLDERFPALPVVVVNTHSDWDHVWGNGAFSGSMIVAHHQCHAFMADDDRWHMAWQCWHDAANGQVERHLPTVTFAESIVFPDDELRCWHTPGHTVDSISLWDGRSRTLFVGDNLEAPIPYLQHHDLTQYNETVAQYASLEPTTIVTAHSSVVPAELIEATKAYLDSLVAGREPSFADLAPEQGRLARQTHATNLKSLATSRVEERARIKWGDEFNTKRFLDLLSWVDDRAVDNQAVEDKAVDDKAVDDKAVDDKAVDDKAIDEWERSLNAALE